MKKTFKELNDAVKRIKSCNGSVEYKCEHISRVAEKYLWGGYI